MSTGSNLIVR